MRVREYARADACACPSTCAGLPVQRIRLAGELMAWFKTALAAYGATALFILLWSSGAIFAEIGVTHASASTFLTMRFALATIILALIGAGRHRWLPARGTRVHVAATGAL